MSRPPPLPPPLLDYDGGGEDKKKPRRRVWLNALLGFLAVPAVITLIVVPLAYNVVPDAQILFFVFLMTVGSLAAAVIAATRPRYRGFLAGFLLAVGLSILCPIALVLVLCGTGQIKPP